MPADLSTVILVTEKCMPVTLAAREEATARSIALPYQIDYAPDAENHLRALTARQRTIVLDAVDDQLAHQPGVETRNRKPMRPNPLAPWEPRIDDLRVYYDIEEKPVQRVLVVAVGIKNRNRILIGGEEVDL